MKLLELNSSEYILRDELDEEDLICLLDLLRDVRAAYNNKPVDVSVGFKQPTPQKEEEAS
jgi:hypothetical protein